MLRLTTHRTARAFLADTGAWLAEREAEHNLMLGIADHMSDEADADGDPGAGGQAVAETSAGRVARDPRPRDRDRGSRGEAGLSC